MGVALRTDSFDPWAELAAAPHGDLAPGQYGATCAFTGTMRDFNEGASVDAMFLEHYPGMTERQLEAIVAEQAREHELLATQVIHRVGLIHPGETIVLVATWSAHRRAAFEGARAIMEALKHRAPFWKRETRGQGEAWVQANTPG